MITNTTLKLVSSRIKRANELNKHCPIESMFYELAVEDIKSLIKTNYLRG